jgi:pyrroline-5-carboxylate reductase
MEWAALDEVADTADILLLAVPPQATIEILKAIGSRLVPSQIIISFAACVG